MVLVGFQVCLVGKNSGDIGIRRSLPGAIREELQQGALAEQQQVQVREYEKQIDRMVYAPYGLTKEEIRIVKGETT